MNLTIQNLLKSKNLDPRIITLIEKLLQAIETGKKQENDHNFTFFEALSDLDVNEKEKREIIKIIETVICDQPLANLKGQFDSEPVFYDTKMLLENYNKRNPKNVRLPQDIQLLMIDSEDLFGYNVNLKKEDNKDNLIKKNYNIDNYTSIESSRSCNKNNKMTKKVNSVDKDQNKNRLKMSSSKHLNKTSITTATSTSQFTSTCILPKTYRKKFAYEKCIDHEFDRQMNILPKFANSISKSSSSKKTNKESFLSPTDSITITSSIETLVQSSNKTNNSKSQSQNNLNLNSNDPTKSINYNDNLWSNNSNLHKNSIDFDNKEILKRDEHLLSTKISTEEFQVNKDLSDDCQSESVDDCKNESKNRDLSVSLVQHVEDLDLNIDTFRVAQRDLYQKFVEDLVGVDGYPIDLKRARIERGNCRKLNNIVDLFL